MKTEEAASWIFYSWENDEDTFYEPEDAIERWDLQPGEIFELIENEVRQIGRRRWVVTDNYFIEEVK